MAAGEAINIEARYLANELSISKLEAIFECRLSEEQRIQSLGTLSDLRRHWRTVVKGFKLQQWNEKGRVPPEEIVCGIIGTMHTDWQKLFTEYYDEPDPRLHPLNFRLSPRIMEHMEQNVPEHHRDRFKNFVYGCRVRDISLRPTSSDDFIINKWANYREPEFSLCTSWGECCDTRFRRRNSPHHIPSGPDAHWYNEDEPKPNPTWTDIHVVNDYEPAPLGEGARPHGSWWVFEKTLYAAPGWLTHSSPPRVVHLFALISEDYEILKRVVVKVIGDKYSAKGVEKALASEYDCHANLSATGCRHILKTYGCSVRPKVHPPHLGYLYMEYAEYGDLQDLLDHMENNPGKQIPEPYIWLIFRGLLEAIFAMTCGRAIPKNLPSDESGLGLENSFAFGWEPVINPDIKPLNVVLTRSQDGYYPGYSTAKMIDFGVALPESTFEDSRIKGPGIGTQGWGPPEQRTPADPWNSEYDWTPLHVHSEIFNVAQIILSLMEGKTRINNMRERQAQRMSHEPDYERTYSRTLERLVAHCLQWNPNQRPSLVFLLHWTKQGLEDWEKAYGSVNKLEEEMPHYAKFNFNNNASMLPIGEVAPAHWKGMQRKRRIPAQEALLPPQVYKRPRPEGYVSPGANVSNDPPKAPPEIKGIKANIKALAEFVFPRYFRSNAPVQIGPPAYIPPEPMPADRRIPPGQLKPYQQPGYLQYVAGMGSGEKRIYVGSEDFGPT